MNDAPRGKMRTRKEIEQLLARTRVISGACELDVLVFLYRHPRTLLTNEQLAAFVGYEMKQVAKSIEAFIEAGLLERTQNSMHAARLYVLVLNGPQSGGIKEILDLASTTQGRRIILQVLIPDSFYSSADLPRKKRKLHVVA